MDLNLISVILGAITIIGGFIGVWIVVNVKIKELEVNMLNLKQEQINQSTRMDKIEIYSREDHKGLDEKLDKILETLIKLLAEHDIQKCSYINGKK